MKPILKYAVALLLILALSPIAAFVAYDLATFLPHKPEIETLLAEANPQDRHPPPLVRRYLDIAGEPVMMTATRSVYDRYNPDGETRRPWRFWLWQQALRVHFSEEEILGFYASQTYTGRGGYGLNTAARNLFDKPLNALAEPEIATIVALLPAPSRLFADRQLLEQRRDALLAKSKSW